MKKAIAIIALALASQVQASEAVKILGAVSTVAGTAKAAGIDLPGMLVGKKKEEAKKQEEAAVAKCYGEKYKVAEKAFDGHVPMGVRQVAQEECEEEVKKSASAPAPAKENAAVKAVRDIAITGAALKLLK